MDVASVRASLETERAQLTGQLASADEQLEAIRESRASREDRADAGSGSNDGDPLSVEIENVLRIRRGVSDSLDELDAALARLDAGTYGICSGCGEEIPEARLEAVPFADTCVSCKQGPRFGR